MQISSDQPADDALPFYRPHGNEIALFERAWRNRLPVLIKGPTGCGKTRFVQHMAARLGRPLYTVACHDDLSASDLVGRHLIGADGTYWSDGPLTRAVREGAICYLDEVVEARKDTTVVLHPLTDDRRILPLERTGETLQAPPGFMLVVSYNPGYQNLLKGMKPSTRQRFLAVSFDFPSPELELEVLVGETGIDPAGGERLVRVANALRALKDHDLEEGASTRLLVYAATLIRDGCDAREACRAALVEPLSDDDETLAALMGVVDVILG
ncbi:MAG: CbbQ/NirQ/NorQ/GpvN family protein [Gammaproteobacteria bacterium]|nr:CbbQ/NirQ/NorQ/GpvN family protein [Gammaproteobacteria bacterium]MCP5298620.1 CbbQ/NirQ/NorQ/GpvN family protein [Chromatiaceae bacterium]